MKTDFLFSRIRMIPIKKSITINMRTPKSLIIEESIEIEKKNPETGQ